MISNAFSKTNVCFENVLTNFSSLLTEILQEFPLAVITTYGTRLRQILAYSLFVGFLPLQTVYISDNFENSFEKTVIFALKHSFFQIIRRLRGQKWGFECGSCLSP